MKNITFILLLSFFSCNTQEKNDIDSTSIKKKIIIEEKTVSVYKDSITTNNLEDEKTDNHLIQDSIGALDYLTKEQTTFCPKIKQYLEKVNWRVHSTDNCYVVDLEDSSDISSFVTNLYKLRDCSNLMKESDFLKLLGTPIYRKENKKGVFLEYPFVKYDSISKNKQEVCSYHISKTLNNNHYAFPSVVLISVWPPENPDH